MAIKISGTNVINDSRQLENITNLKTVGSQNILGTGDIPVGGNYAVNNYLSPATWTKQSALKGVKVTLISGGGAGGQGNYSPTYSTQRWGGGGGAGNIGSIYIPAPAIPGPVSVTVGAGGVGIPGGTPTGGGTSSFGSFISITGGTAGGPVTAPVAGTRGTVTTAYTLDTRYTAIITDSWYGISTEADDTNIPGGTLFGWGFGGAAATSFVFGTGGDASGYGSGGGGYVSRPPGTSSPNTTPRPGGDGSPGFVVVEEFY
jgi:hypothetical protein